MSDSETSSSSHHDSARNISSSDLDTSPASSLSSRNSREPSPKRRKTKCTVTQASRQIIQSALICHALGNNLEQEFPGPNIIGNDDNQSVDNDNVNVENNLVQAVGCDCNNDIEENNWAQLLQENSESSSSDPDDSVESYSEHDNTLGDDDSLSGNDAPNSSVNSGDLSHLDSGPDSDDDNPELYANSDMKANDALLNILKVYIEERWTKASLDKSIKMTKKMLPNPNALPSSSWAALNKLSKLTGKYSSKLHRFCVDCDGFVDCGCTDSVTSFYSFSMEDQLRHMFEQRNLASIVDYYRDHCKGRDGYICDIRDGLEFKHVKQFMLGLYDLILLWNTDGVCLSSSSKNELWIILATICEVPPRLRPSFMLVCGVYVGEKKPDMNIYLKPFASALNKLWTEGFQWTHPISETVQTSKVIAPVLSADAPAKAMVMKVMNFNSRFGCNICEQKSEKIYEPPLPGKKSRAKRRFLYHETPAQLRNHERMNLQGELAEVRRKPRKGVIGPATVTEIPCFDRAKSICAEYMHLVLLGVVKYLLNKIFFEPGEWYIGDKQRQIDDCISGFKVPDFVRRLPRGVKDFKYWKASEFRTFLLFYSLPIFKEMLPKRFFQHWIILVSAINILLQEAVSDNDLNKAEVMLQCFVRDVGVLYGQRAYTYNMHNLLHLTLLIRRWGNLFATSAFVFESYNGYITARVHGTKHSDLEFVNNITVAHQVAAFENVNSNRCNVNWSPNRSHVVVVLGKPLSPNEIVGYLPRNMLDMVLYRRARRGLTIFTSKIYDAKFKRADSYIQYKDGNVIFYGQILAFLTTANGSISCYVQVFKIVQTQLFVHTHSRTIIKHLIPVEATESCIVIPIDNIVTKVLRLGMYLGITPNSYEVCL